MQVRGLLFKLQAVFDLPRRVRTALEQDAVEIAVDHYAEAAPLLKRYGHKVFSVVFCVGLLMSWCHEEETEKRQKSNRGPQPILPKKLAFEIAFIHYAEAAPLLRQPLLNRYGHKVCGEEVSPFMIHDF